MKPPPRVKVGPFTYAIVFDLAAIDRSSASDEAEKDGECDHNKQRVVVRPGLGPDLTADTVLHEILHAVTENTGLTFDLESLEKGTEERVVRRLSPALLDLLRRNPALVRYLTS